MPGHRADIYGGSFKKEDIKKCKGKDGLWQEKG